jgi:hypothetical protein
MRIKRTKQLVPRSYGYMVLARLFDHGLISARSELINKNEVARPYFFWPSRVITHPIVVCVANIDTKGRKIVFSSNFVNVVILITRRQSNATRNLTMTANIVLEMEYQRWQLRHLFSFVFLNSKFTILCSLFHRSIVRVRFQVILGTWPTKEMNDLLFCLADLRHGVSLLGISGSIEPAFWSRDAEASASSDASASCYSFSEDIGVFPVVVPELKFVQIKRQILLTDIVVRPDNAPLEQRPEAFDVVCVDVTANVLILRMLDGFVRKSTRCLQVVIAAMVIGRYKAHTITNGFTDETVQRRCVGLLNNLTNDVTLAGYRPNNGDFSAQAGDVLLFVPMAVLVFSTKTHLIDFDDAHKLLKIIVPHTGTEPVAHKPCGMSRGTFAEIHAPNLTRGYALETLEHGVKHLEPRQDRDVGILENRPDQNREAIRIGVLVGFSAALPRERASRALVYFNVPADRALRTCRPSPHGQIESASFFVGKRRHELLKGSA